jgi:NAD(P)-dependent dehydrogenase (short-subunit alcohol dehydrogenase family)
VNFLSHVLLTMTILPSLARAEDPRIICTTSCMQYLGRFLPRSDANHTAKPVSYSNNKLYFQTWLTELQARLSANPSLDHVAVHGVHPGFVNTGIWTATKTAEEREEEGKAKGSQGDGLLSFFVSWFGIDAQQGSLAIVRAATAKECASTKRGGEGGGRYFNRIWPAVPMPHTLDPWCRQEIWDFADEELRLKEKGLLNVFDGE